MTSLKLFTISKTRIPQALEERMSNKADGRQEKLECEKCFACNRSIHGMKFYRAGMVLVLFDLFQHGPNMVEGQCTIDAVAKKIIYMRDAKKKIWGKKNAKPKDAKAALMILIAAGILEYNCVYEPERQLELSLKVSEEGPPNLAYTDKEAWLQIPPWYMFEE